MNSSGRYEVGDRCIGDSLKWIVVTLLKKIVPEFISNNSEYEALDYKQTNDTQNQVVENINQQL